MTDGQLHPFPVAGIANHQHFRGLKQHIRVI